MLDGKARAEASRKRLCRWRDLLRDIPLCERRLQNLQQRLDSLGSQSMGDGMPRSIGFSKDRLSGLIASKVDLENEIKRKKALAKTELEQIKLIISRMDSAEERFVLLARYVDLEDWKVIITTYYDKSITYGEEYDRMARAVYRKHGSALLSFSYAEEGLKTCGGDRPKNSLETTRKSKT